MITEKLIRDAYTFLREKNNTIPSEVLDFMLWASIDKLNQLESNKCTNPKTNQQ